MALRRYLPLTIHRQIATLATLLEQIYNVTLSGIGSRLNFGQKPGNNLTAFLGTH
jgi:hypothetical protein